MVSSSASVIAPLERARRKDTRSPWPVAASSNTFPTSVARAARSTNVLSRSAAGASPSRKKAYDAA